MSFEPMKFLKVSQKYSVSIVPKIDEIVLSNESTFGYLVMMYLLLVVC